MGDNRPHYPADDSLSEDSPASVGDPPLRGPNLDVVSRAFGDIVRSCLKANGLAWGITTCDTQTIERLEDIVRLVLDACKIEAATRVANLHKNWNALFGRPKFPAEVNIRVLESVIQSEEYPIKRLADLSTLSTGWWTTIRDTPSLWTSVRTTCRRAELAIARSGSLPLHVTLDDSLIPRYWKLEKVLVQHRHNRIISQSDRWKTLTTDHQGSLSCNEHFPKTLPLVESVDVSARNYPLPLPVLCGGPRLRYLRLSGVISVPWSSVNVKNLISLEVTRVTAEPDWGIKLMEALGPNTRLERLTLEDIEDPWWAEPSLPPPASTPITMHSLTSLTLVKIHLPTLYSVLGSIRAPCLSTSRIDNNGPSSALLDSLTTSDGTPTILRSFIENSKLSHLIISLSDYRLPFDHKGVRWGVWKEGVLTVTAVGPDWLPSATKIASIVSAADLGLPVRVRLVDLRVKAEDLNFLHQEKAEKLCSHT